MKKIKPSDFAKMFGVSRQNINYHIRKNKDKGYFFFQKKKYYFDTLELGNENRNFIILSDDGEGEDKD